MKPLLLIGCGGHAKAVIDIVEESNLWEIIGLIGVKSEVGKTICGYKVIGSNDDLPNLRSKCKNVFIGIGEIGENKIRCSLARELENLGYDFPILCSNFSKISNNSNIGIGTSIGHGVVINAYASIGKHCIINSQSLIEHQAVVSDHCHISTGVLINGDVWIGENCFIGSGAILREGIRLPPNTIISAGKRIMGWPLIEK